MCVEEQYVLAVASAKEMHSQEWSTIQVEPLWTILARYRSRGGEWIRFPSEVAFV